MENLPQSYELSTRNLRVAREIAIDLYPLETILDNYKINPNEWETLKANPRFLAVLETEVLAWNSASNTAERTKLKSGALFEEWLLEANTLLHDPKQVLSAKVELAKLIAKVAEVGERRIEGGGDRFTVTINLGADNKLTFDKAGVTSKVIEGEVL